MKKKLLCSVQADFSLLAAVTIHYYLSLHNSVTIFALPSKSLTSIFFFVGYNCNRVCVPLWIFSAAAKSISFDRDHCEPNFGEQAADQPNSLSSPKNKSQLKHTNSRKRTNTVRIHFDSGANFCEAVLLCAHLFCA